MLNEEDILEHRVTESEINLLHRIQLVTLIKIIDSGTEFQGYLILGEGFTLDCVGNCMFVDNIILGLANDETEVAEKLHIFEPGSLHWAKCSYVIDEYDSLSCLETWPVSPNDYKAVNAFFPEEIAPGTEPQEGEYWFGGKVYKAGRKGDGTIRNIKAREKWMPVDALKMHTDAITDTISVQKHIAQQITSQQNHLCYCCKGTDFWLAGTEEHPHWECRKCHPPAPGAELVAG